MKEILEKLGLGGWEILFHAVNLAILIVALYFLLYKPVKKLLRITEINSKTFEKKTLDSEKKPKLSRKDATA